MTREQWVMAIKHQYPRPLALKWQLFPVGDGNPDHEH